MRKFFFRLCQKLYFKKLLPWAIWSTVYDRWHRMALSDD